MKIRFIQHNTLMAAALLLTLATVQAQVSTATDPAEFAIDDEVSLVVSYGGDAPVPSPSGTLQVIHTYGTGYEMNVSQATISTVNSWLFPEGYVADTFYADTELNRIVIRITVPTSAPDSGYGEIFRLEGIIIEYEDVLSRRSKATLQSELSIATLPGAWMVQVPAQMEGGHLELRTLSGQLAGSWPHATGAIKVSQAQLASGIYVFSLRRSDAFIYLKTSVTAGR
ncbi:MAG: hypothetical protein OHK0039_19800 [Bacteroidia bacterium]